MYSQEIKDRFWSKVNKTDNCWEWTTGLNKNGYGHFHANGEDIRAHRFSFQNHHNRLIQEGLCIMHICDNRKCVNPAHLSEGTKQDNSTDMVNKCRSAKGEKHHLSKLTEKQVLEIRSKYAKGGTTHRQLAKEYGIVKSVINYIINRKTWTYI